MLGLWSAAPVLGRVRTLPGRTAMTLALGCLIPLVLAFANLLYWWSLWCVLGALLVVQYMRNRPERAARDPLEERPWDLVIGFAVLLALAWPIAVRPTMDGDTFIYHLPNAASWVTQHGIWTTGTRYWWYPPTSELFASGLLAIGGVGVVGFAGLLPAVLLLLTIRDAARRNGMPAITGTLAACALLATPVAVVQLVSLQNDLWQSALFVYALTEFTPAAFGALALTKPNGLLYALAAAVAWASGRKEFLKALAFSIGLVALWAARDLILWPHAIVPPGTTVSRWLSGTTIAAHMPHSLVVLATASWHAGIVWAAFFAFGIASIVFPRQVYLRWAALAAVVLFAIVPTGYEGTDPQLATGASLRYGLPVGALGLLWLVLLPQRAAPFITLASAIAVVAGVVAQWQLFYIDATTRDAPIIVAVTVLIAVGALLLRDPRLRIAVGAALSITLAALAGGLARSHPTDYIAYAFGGGFAFVASEHVVNVVTLGLPAGAIITVDPNVNAFDGVDEGTCAQARSLDAVILMKVDRLGKLDCGRVLYRDTRTAVVDPAI